MYIDRKYYFVSEMKYIIEQLKVRPQMSLDVVLYKAFIWDLYIIIY